MFSIYVIFVAIITTSLVVSKTYATVGESLRHTTFLAASLLSTSGFGSVNYETWPMIAQILLFALMFMGGSAGSTAGGLKVSRLIILSKSSMLSAHKMLSPRSVKTVRLEGKPLSEETVHNTQRYFVLYSLIMVVSIILISLDTTVKGTDGLMTCISAVVTCFNNVGPGFGAVGPAYNFADLGIFTKIILTMDMLIGRLEILPILLIFYPKSWRSI